jgi:hypothetical protein
VTCSQTGLTRLCNWFVEYAAQYSASDEILVQVIFVDAFVVMFVVVVVVYYCVMVMSAVFS